MNKQAKTTQALLEEISLLRQRIQVLEESKSAQKVLIEALQESEVRFRELAELLPEIVFETDLQGILTFINRNAFDRSGFTSADFERGMNVSDMVISDDRDRVLENIQKIINRESVANNEFTIRKKDGTTFPSMIYSSTITRNGKPIGLRGLVVNITERKRAEEVLQEGKTKLEAIFNTVGSGIFIIDRDTQIIIEANQAAIEMTGLPREKIIGQICHSLVCPALAGQCPVKDLGQRIDHSERKLLHADGREKDILKTVYPIKIEGRECYIESFIDITERKLSELELLKHETKLSSIFRAAPVGIGMLINRVFKETNDMLCRMTGYSSEELLGRNALMLYPSQADYDYVGQEKYLQISQKGTGTVETRWKKKDGTIIDIILRSTPLDPNDLGKGVTFTALDITDRKQAENALKESERRFKELSDLLPEAVFESDMSMRLTFVNKKAIALFGYTEEDLTAGLNCTNMLVLGDRERAVINIAKRMSGIDTGAIEYTALKKDGSTFPALISATSIKQNGKPVGLRGIIIDITERKKTEQALQESELFSSEIQRIARLGGWKANPHSDYLKWTDGVYDIIEAPPDYKPNLSEGIKVFQNDYIPIINNNLTRCLATGEPFTIECEAMTVTGKKLWTEVRGLVPVMEGEYSSVVGTFQDITERKRMEEKLINSLGELQKGALRYEALIAASNTGAWEYNEESGFLWCSPEYFSMLGRNPDEFNLSGTRNIEQTWINLLHPEDHDKASQYFASYLKNPSGMYEQYFRMQHQNGSWVWIWSRGKSLRDKEGKPTGITVGTHIDVTEVRKIQERLQRAEKMEALGLLSGGVAHDLNNVLGILIGYSELLLNRIEESSPVKPYATNIMTASERAAAIVQDMLTLARRGVQDRKAVSINTLVLDFLKAPECEAITTLHPNVEVKTNLKAELLPIMGAPAQLDKTIMNLVSNAAEAMAKGGLVTIATDNQYLDGSVSGYDEIMEGDYVVLSVSDQGEGIPANDIKHIFEPFYTKKVMGKSGTGLGLAVVWGTVKDHNGYIDVWSKEGQGSTFTLYFPATRDKLSAESAPISISEYMSHGESILVVDDVQGQRELAAEMLRSLNYSVNVASSGEEAVAYLKDHTVDLLVLDMIMDPGIDGLETYKRIIDFCPKQKAIIVSGFSETDKVKLAQELGAGPFVRKPYVLERLGMAVRQELERT